MHLLEILSAPARRFAASRLIAKRETQTSPEPLLNFIHRYVWSRALVTLFLLYCLMHYTIDPIACSTNSKLQSSLNQLVCYFKQTYLVKLANTSTIQDKDFIGPIRVPSQTIGYRVERQTYYQHLIAILLALYLINLVANIVQHKAKHFRANLFDRRSASACCAAKSLETVLATVKSNLARRFIAAKLFANYLLIDEAPLLAIYASIALLDACFNRKFLPFGVRIIAYYCVDPEYFSAFRNYGEPKNGAENEPFEDLFPIFTKCDIRLTGVTGSAQSADALCVLKYNYVNRIVFAALWLAYALMAIAFLGSLWWRIVAIAVPAARRHRIGGALDLIRLVVAAAGKRANGPNNYWQDLKPHALSITAKEMLILECVQEFERYKLVTKCVALSMRLNAFDRYLLKSDQSNFRCTRNFVSSDPNAKKEKRATPPECIDTNQMESVCEDFTSPSIRSCSNHFGTDQQQAKQCIKRSSRMLSLNGENAPKWNGYDPIELGIIGAADNESHYSTIFEMDSFRNKQISAPNYAQISIKREEAYEEIPYMDSIELRKKFFA